MFKYLKAATSRFCQIAVNGRQANRNRKNILNTLNRTQQAKLFTRDVVKF